MLKQTNACCSFCISSWIEHVTLLTTITITPLKSSVKEAYLQQCPRQQYPSIHQISTVVPHLLPLH